MASTTTIVWNLIYLAITTQSSLPAVKSWLVDITKGNHFISYLREGFNIEIRNIDPISPRIS